MKVTFIKASTEARLEKEIRKLEAAHNGMLKVINVYESRNGYTCWYYHDYQKAGMPSTNEKETTEVPSKPVKKKKTRKKVSKKAVE
jgi:hypothetical protein